MVNTATMPTQFKGWVSRMRSQDDVDPEDRVPPRGLGWFFVIGSPLFAVLVTVWYWEDGLASILLDSWYMLVTFTFGAAILWNTRAGREA